MQRSCSSGRSASRYPWSQLRVNQTWVDFEKLVRHCNTLTGESLKHTCGTEHQLALQHEWLRQVQSPSAEDWLAAYFRALYDLDEGIGPLIGNVLNVSRVAFFWALVPRRSAFRALWSCVQCTRRGLRLDGVLWAPSEEASANPIHRPARKHCLDLLLEKGTSRLQSVNSTCGQQLSPAGPGHALHARMALHGRTHRYWDADRGDASSIPVHFPGFFVSRRANEAASNFSWVEVLRVARDDIGDRHPAGRCTRGQLWFWVAPGTGIWLNVGRTQSMLSQHQIERSGGCKAARERGIDTIQIAEAFGGYSHELVDCRATGQAGADDVWEAACPPPHVELRSGIPSPINSLYGGVVMGTATTSSSCECHCNPALDFLVSKAALYMFSRMLVFYSRCAITRPVAHSSLLLFGFLCIHK